MGTSPKTSIIRSGHQVAKECPAHEVANAWLLHVTAGRLASTAAPTCENVHPTCCYLAWPMDSSSRARDQEHWCGYPLALGNYGWCPQIASYLPIDASMKQL